MKISLSSGNLMRSTAVYNFAVVAELVELEINGNVRFESGKYSTSSFSTCSEAFLTSYSLFE